MASGGVFELMGGAFVFMLQTTGALSALYATAK
jgi:hypothetical protein